MLLLPGEVAPHPNDPVELRRVMFQTPGPVFNIYTHLLNSALQRSAGHVDFTSCYLSYSIWQTDETNRVRSFMDLPSRILNLYWTKWALAFVCYSFFFFLFFLVTCARLSWSLSFWVSVKLFFSYRIASYPFRSRRKHRSLETFCIRTAYASCVTRILLLAFVAEFTV